ARGGHPADRGVPADHRRGLLLHEAPPRLDRGAAERARPVPALRRDHHFDRQRHAGPATRSAGYRAGVTAIAPPSTAETSTRAPGGGCGCGSGAVTTARGGHASPGGPGTAPVVIV